MEPSEALEFVADNHRAVLATRRRDGRPQLSPVLVVGDGEGRILVSTRETAMKTHNVERDPAVTVCVMNDGFFGKWALIDGTAEIVQLPEAMDLLVDYYRRVAGEHDDWDEYRDAMRRERRVVLRITVERAGPDRSG